MEANVSVLMSEYDDAYVDAMPMVNMQANIRSVTVLVCLIQEVSTYI